MSAIGPWLSTLISTGPDGRPNPISSSDSRRVDHMASFVAYVCAIYSASQEDRAIDCCLLEDQLTAPP